MFRLGKIVAAIIALVAVSATAAASRPPTVPGTWRKVAPMPLAIPQSRASVWTGRQLIVLGRKPVVNPSVNVAESYDPVSNRWTRLSPPPGPEYVPGFSAVWTGKEMLAFDPFHSVAYNPRTNAWRELRKSINLGFVAWTGREAIGWGGGCCGDVQSNGTAYDPSTDTYRNLPRSPLAPSQQPLGAWTGRELVLFVSGLDPEGKPYPTRRARAAAYDPAENTWRRIAPLPRTGQPSGGTAVWDGHEVLVTGTGKTAQSALAFNPTTNRWRRLASLPAPRVGATGLWTGKRLVLWGGQSGRYPKLRNTRDGLAYDPAADRWSPIPHAPLVARSGSAVAWTGRSLLVVGGGRQVCKPGGVYGCHEVTLVDGGAFTPTTP